MIASPECGYTLVESVSHFFFYLLFDGMSRWKRLFSLGKHTGSNKFVSFCKDGLDTLILSSGPSCSKLTMLLVSETLTFQTYCKQKHNHFFPQKCEKLSHCKTSSHFFSKKKIISTLDFMCTGKLSEYWTYHLKIF